MNTPTFYEKTEQILTGYEILFPEDEIVQKIRFLIEKLNYKESTTQELVADFFEVVKQMGHYPITSLFVNMNSTAGTKEFFHSVLRLIKYIGHDILPTHVVIMLRNFNVDEYEQKDIKLMILSILDELYQKERAKYWQDIKSIILTKDSFALLKKYLDFYHDTYHDPSFLALKKALEHFITLQADNQLWRFLYQQTENHLLENVRYIRLTYPNYKIHEAFSKGQIKSKLWAVEELNKLENFDESKIIILCGWIGFLSYLLLKDSDKSQISHILSIDIDQETTQIAKKFNRLSVEVDDARFVADTSDVYKLDYGPLSFKSRLFSRLIKEPLPYDVIINTSCEHLVEFKDWYDLIPKGQMVLLQSNNYFECDEHHNCISNLADFKKEVPMKEYLYEGTLDLSYYKRFMLIGIK